MSKTTDPLLFSSHRLKELVKQLYIQVASDRSSLFDQTLILVPHPAMKEWIQLECCRLSEERAILGWEFGNWLQGISLISSPLPCPSRMDLSAALWRQIKESPRSEWKPFLSSERKKLDLVEQCTSLFSDYSLYGLPKERENWQIELFDELFQKYSWQTMEQALETAPIHRSGSLYLFGFDWIPPAAYRFYLRHPQLRIFRFSPTAMFLDDVRSARERKTLLAHVRKKEIAEANVDAFEELLRQEHPLIANWSVLGRKMNEVMGDLEPLENYELLKEPSTLLEKLQSEFLTMESVDKSPDDSILLLQAGASRLREVEILRDEILRCRSLGIPFSEMRVYAPDMEPFAPLIEFVFANQIPFRIGGIDIARQSSYFQALERICKLVSGRWQAGEWAALLDTKAFYLKQGWQRDDIEQIKEWIELSSVRWGTDSAHQNEVTRETVAAAAGGFGTWEEGFDRLIDSWVYFDPEREKSLSWSDADLFHSFHSLFTQIRETLFSWKTEKTLEKWAEEIEKLSEEYLVADENSEEDSAAKNMVARALSSLRKAHEKMGEATFPFSFVKHHLFSPSQSEEGASQLHGVRFLSLEPGSILPAQALFILGMDEENFPRMSAPSSLHLLKKGKVYLPQSGDWDRYLFLEAMFAAEKRLILIYGHRSKEDGKGVSPSLVVQELFGYLGWAEPLTKTPPALAIDPRCFYEGSPVPSRSVADYRAALTALEGNPGSLFETPIQRRVLGEKKTISIRALRRWLSHPLKQYLEQIVGLSFKEEVESKWSDFESSGLIRHLFLSEALREPIGQVMARFTDQKKFPPGIIGESIQRDLAERAREMQKRLEEWNIQPASIQTIEFKETSTELKQVSESRIERGPLEFEIMGSKVQLVGEVALAVPGGSLHLGEDSIGGILKYWPEHLCSILVSEGAQIYSLRTGKEKSVKDPKEALKAVVELYLQFEQSPLFLHSSWADPMLRKNSPIDPESEDRTLQWILKRSPQLDLEKEREMWAPLLQKAFSSLIDLFPTRKARSSDADL